MKRLAVAVPKVPMPHSAEQILQQEFLLARARILELAATLDRIERAEGQVAEHPQMRQLRQGFEILTSTSDERAQQVQLLFSRQYSEDWRREFGV